MLLVVDNARLRLDLAANQVRHLVLGRWYLKRK